MKEGVTIAELKAGFALLHVAEIERDLGQVPQNFNEFEGRLRKVRGDSGCQLIPLSPILIKRAGVNKKLSGIIALSVSIFDCFIN